MRAGSNGSSSRNTEQDRHVWLLQCLDEPEVIRSCSGRVTKPTLIELIRDRGDGVERPCHERGFPRTIPGT